MYTGYITGIYYSIRWGGWCVKSLGPLGFTKKHTSQKKNPILWWHWVSKNILSSGNVKIPALFYQVRLT